MSLPMITTADVDAYLAGLPEGEIAGDMGTNNHCVLANVMRANHPTARDASTGYTTGGVYFEGRMIIDYNFAFPIGSSITHLENSVIDRAANDKKVTREQALALRPWAQEEQS